MSPEVLQREVAQIFTQQWVCVGHLGALTGPGSFLSGLYLEMPWVVTKAEDGQLRAFHNVRTGCAFQESTWHIVCSFAFVLLTARALQTLVLLFQGPISELMPPSPRN